MFFIGLLVMFFGLLWLLLTMLVKNPDEENRRKGIRYSVAALVLGFVLTICGLPGLGHLAVEKASEGFQESLQKSLSH